MCAAVGVDHATIRPDDEVGAHLEGALGRSPATREAAAGGQQAHIGGPDGGRKRRSAETFPDTVWAVDAAVGVEQDRRREPEIVGVPGGAFRRGGADIEDLGAKRLELRLGTPQLRRVLAAGQSGEVPQEIEHDRPAL